ncbi:hypothetical protein [Planctomycetes bacterium CA13]|uniref:hypothetical protein n=1 Tax=Novipirellula herctigrandis TaxID=2527986 RepID=UPI0011B40B86
MDNQKNQHALVYSLWTPVTTHSLAVTTHLLAVTTHSLAVTTHLLAVTTHSLAVTTHLPTVTRGGPASEATKLRRQAQQPNIHDP